VFEALDAKRPLVVVPNPVLMDNHQAELAEHLQQRRVAVCAEPEGASLAKAVRALGKAGAGGRGGGSGCALAEYEPGDPRGIARRLDQLMGRAGGLI
jgi:beta-1,4-N-acetylglucosaminyltransferase